LRERILQMGPICIILPERSLDDTLIAEIDIYIGSIGMSVEKGSAQKWSFWVRPDKLFLAESPTNGCQFSIYIDDGTIQYSELPAENEARQIENKLGYRPAYNIVLDAGCNQDFDHLLLAKMASKLLDMFGGYVNFNGDLPLSEEEVLAIEGKLFNVSYQVENNTYHYHIADSMFLNNWIAHPKFRMIK
jgi:uncharacterized protein DUF6368